MVHILDRDIRHHPLETHCLQFEHHQRSGCILGQRLVDANTDHLPRGHLPFE